MRDYADIAKEIAADVAARPDAYADRRGEKVPPEHRHIVARYLWEAVRPYSRRLYRYRERGWFIRCINAIMVVMMARFWEHAGCPQGKPWP